MSRINLALKDRQVFVAIVEKGSFRMAAESLIEKLEKSLRLLDRTTRRAEMTNIGRQFLEEARAALDILDNAAFWLGDEATLQRGLVTVAAIPPAALHFLPRAASFWRSRRC